MKGRRLEGGEEIGRGEREDVGWERERSRMEEGGNLEGERKRHKKEGRRNRENMVGKTEGLKIQRMDKKL